MLAVETGTALQDDVLAQLEIDLPDKGFAVIDHFLNPQQTDAIYRRFEDLRSEDQFKKAGIGKGKQFRVVPEVRGDVIYWIDKNEAHESVRPVLKDIKELMQYFNRWFFLSLKDYEMHYAMYPPGKFYARHADRFGHNPHRHISFVIYLNRDWKEGDGGELVIFNEDEEIQITPLAGRLAVFRSELEHEVLITSKPRYSITGWMLDRPVGLTFL